MTRPTMSRHPLGFYWSLNGRTCYPIYRTEAIARAAYRKALRTRAPYFFGKA